MNIKIKQTNKTPDVQQGRDFFRTPRYAVELLLDAMPVCPSTVWECVAGNLDISKVLKECGISVVSSDIVGEAIRHNFVTDCPDYFVNLLKRVDRSMIITNPPYSLSKEFLDVCLSIGLPFALLINSNYCKWKMEAIYKHGCEKILPTGRINYITPTGRSGGNSSSHFHTMWLTRGIGLGKSETFVELTKEMKERIF